MSGRRHHDGACNADGSPARTCTAEHSPRKVDRRLARSRLERRLASPRLVARSRMRATTSSMPAARTPPSSPASGGVAGPGLPSSSSPAGERFTVQCCSWTRGCPARPRLLVDSYCSALFMDTGLPSSPSPAGGLPRLVLFVDAGVQQTAETLGLTLFSAAARLSVHKRTWRCVCPHRKRFCGTSVAESRRCALSQRRSASRPCSVSMRHANRWRRHGAAHRRRRQPPGRPSGRAA